MNLRLLAPEDMPQAKALWQLAFDDTPTFVDWFFENRFTPEWSAGLFSGERLITAIHGKPMRLSAGERAFDALMISGVATVPEERGRGHMFATMGFLREHAEKQGVRAFFNHPQNPGSYRHLGFRNSTFTKYWRGEGRLTVGSIAPFEEEAAFSIYQTVAKNYDGMVLRDKAEFHLKMEDYRAGDGQAFLMQDGGRPIGYCVYFEGSDGIYGEEVLSAASYQPLLHELLRLANGRPVAAKLPPDADASGELLPQNVMLAPRDVWAIMGAKGRISFCVDEY